MDLKTIIFIGKSGSGKGTQVERIKNLLSLKGDGDVYHLQTGNGFREFIKGSSYTSVLSRDRYKSGKLQPAYLAIWNWANIFIQNFTGKEHLLIDGTPRRLDEARLFCEALDFYGRKNVYVVYIDVSDKWATEKLLKRGRDDDNIEEIKARLEWFENKVTLAVDFLKERDGYHFYKIDGEQSIGDVHNEIVEKLNL